MRNRLVITLCAVVSLLAGAGLLTDRKSVV